MKRTWMMMGVGAGLMYLLDPERGKRRRALLRDKIVHGVHQTADGFSVARRDAANRIRGFAASVESRGAGGAMNDELLTQRVRSRLGRLVTHPSAIEVAARDGEVTLSGPILRDEVPRLLRRVRRVPGVRHVQNRLSIYDEAGNIPALQGHPLRPEHEFEYLQNNWSPAARLFALLAGAGISAYGAMHRGAGGAATAVTGLGLMARSAANKPIKRLIGLGEGALAVDYVKTVNFDAPIERVFEVWSDFERFPEFMSHVKDVRRIDERRLHWTVEGPLGSGVEWTSLTTEFIPNQLIAWKTEPGAQVEQSGQIRFQRDGDGKTRAHISLSYDPVGGVAGNLVASLFGANPKREIDDDLMRMKSFIETGKHPHDAARHVEGGHEARV